MRKNIWVFNHYAEPPQYETRVRNNAMAKYLMQAGYDVTILGASTIHNTDINLITDGSPFIRREYDGLKFIHINVPGYSGNGLSRKLNLLAFPYLLWKYTKKLGEKPDVIVNDLDVMAMAFPFMIAKRYRCPIITEVRDLWPESIIEYGLLKRNSLLAKFLYAIEHRMYMKSDDIVFTAEGLYDYIIEKGWEKKVPREKVHFINNGVDLELFNYNRDNYQIQDSDLANPNTFKVIYTGSIRRVNNLNLLLDVATKITIPNVKFLIWGTGDELELLQKRVEDERIGNVVFKGHVEKKYVPYIVSQADLNIAHNTPTAMFRFGISFNKIFDYMASCKPSLSDFPCKYNPLVQYGTGISVDSAKPEDIARAIESFIQMDPDTYKAYCDRASFAAQQYDFKKLTQDLIQIIEKKR